MMLAEEAIERRCALLVRHVQVSPHDARRRAVAGSAIPGLGRLARRDLLIAGRGRQRGKADAHHEAKRGCGCCSGGAQHVGTVRTMSSPIIEVQYRPGNGGAATYPLWITMRRP